jgi:type IV pilus assembly protein PilC
MATFSYTARDTRTGERVKAEIEADSQKAVTKNLMEKGLMPLDISQKEAKGGAVLKNRVPTKAKVIFSRQLSTLINAGLPLSQSLHTVEGQTANKNLKIIISKVIGDVEAGSAFSEALGRHPQVFSDVFVSLVAAGEESGTLDMALDRLALQQEKDAEIVSKVRGAMIYPLIVMVVLGAVLVFMLTTVLPQVQQLYKNLPGAKLPVLTKMLLSLSHAMTHYWWIFLLGFIAAAFLFFRWSRTKQGEEALDGIKMHIWPVGPLFMKLYMARFARTSSTLAASGVPMLKMLSTTADAVGNVHIKNSIAKASEAVKGGKSLSQSLEGDPNFLDLVPNMIHIGEQSGSLDGMLGKVADYYEKEVDNQIKSVSTIIEPVMMLVVGVIALVVVAAVLLPIYSLAGTNVLPK